MQGARGAARSIAQLVSRLIVEKGQADQARLDDIVDSFALVSEAWVVYVLDLTGTTIAASNRGWPDSFLGKNYAGRPYYQEARAGRTGQFMGMGIVSRIPGYFSSEPARGADGKVAAIAVVKLNLTREQLGPARIDEACIASPDGEVLLASREGRAGQRLWSDRAAPPAGVAPPGAPPATAPAFMDRGFVGTEWVSIDGRRKLATRLPIAASDWSLVVFKSAKTQVANRVLGIVITLLLCSMILTYFVAMQRQFGVESAVADKRRQAEGRAREFARKADTDALTGVLNRLGFNGAFSREFERARRYRQPLSVVILDLDHFKRVNDDHGHVAGDQVLMGVARLVEAHIRESDIVARWGGEEFVVLAPMTPLQGGGQLAEKLRAQLEQTPLGPAGPVTASLGVAELLPGDSMEALLHRADEALYRVKNGGRNAVALGAPDPAEGAGPEPAPARLEQHGTSFYADTGFAPIDEEHRALAEALESFVRKVNAGRAAEVQLALEAILVSAGAHFGHEERLMLGSSYPLRQRHGENHALFVEDARRFLEELRANGLTLSFRRWAVGRLLEWFRLHVLAHDVALGRFLREAGSLEAPPRDMVG
jgi:diguanylate cyclase (GGDEF)-like protein/hemerythrin-like metal-binding protein